MLSLNPVITEGGTITHAVRSEPSGAVRGPRQYADFDGIKACYARFQGEPSLRHRATVVWAGTPSQQMLRPGQRVMLITPSTAHEIHSEAKRNAR